MLEEITIFAGESVVANGGLKIDTLEKEII